MADKKEIQTIKDEVDKAVDDAILFGQTSEEPKPEDTYEDLYVTCEVPR